MPVVEAGPAHRVLVDGEAELADQVERATGRRAQPRDIAGIGRDLGLYQDDMKATACRSGAQTSRWPIVRDHDRRGSLSRISRAASRGRPRDSGPKVLVAPLQLLDARPARQVASLGPAGC